MWVVVQWGPTGMRPMERKFKNIKLAYEFRDACNELTLKLQGSFKSIRYGVQPL